MQEYMILAILAGGFVLGGSFTLMFYRTKLQNQKDIFKKEIEYEILLLSEKIEEKEKEIFLLQKDADALRGELTRLTKENSDIKVSEARLKTKLEEEVLHSEEKIQILQKAKEQLKVEFENLANKIFEDKNKKLNEQNKININTIIKPFEEQIKEFGKRVNDAYVKEAKERFSLTKEIEKLKELNMRISEDAINLTNALKGESKTQGAWGEIVLERVLEDSGLVKGREYQTQEGYKSEEGDLYKPDAIIFLPESKNIVIDAKVSLSAYERFCSSSGDDKEANIAIKQHLDSIYAHIKGLSSKKYEALEGIESLDFVLLFIPIEGAFMLAIQNDNSLYRKAYEKNIILVSPSTLLVTLRTIENIWRYEYQNKNAQEIAKRAGDLYDKFVGFTEDMDKIGAQLEKTGDVFGAAYGKLSSGKGNLVSRANKLKELGVKSRKNLSEK